MKWKKYIAVVITMVLVCQLFSTDVFAATICKTGGSGVDLKRECITDTKVTTKKTNMSSVHFFPYGGSMSRSESTTTSVSLSASLSIGAKVWLLGQISSSFSVTGTLSQTIGVTASWNVPAGMYSQIRAIFPRTRLDLLRFDYQDAKEFVSQNTVNSSINYYITAECW